MIPIPTPSWWFHLISQRILILAWWYGAFPWSSWWLSSWCYLREYPPFRELMRLNPENRYRFCKRGRRRGRLQPRERFEWCRIRPRRRILWKQNINDHAHLPRNMNQYADCWDTNLSWKEVPRRRSTPCLLAKALSWWDGDKAESWRARVMSYVAMISGNTSLEILHRHSELYYEILAPDFVIFEIYRPWMC